MGVMIAISESLTDNGAFRKESPIVLSENLVVFKQFFVVAEVFKYVITIHFKCHLIFSKPLYYQAWLLEHYGFPHIRFHELRHSCASMLIAVGFTLKDVQEWLGHSDIKMTANIYSHLDVTRKQSIAKKLGNQISA
jgi:integrase